MIIRIAWQLCILGGVTKISVDHMDYTADPILMILSQEAKTIKTTN